MLSPWGAASCRVVLALAGLAAGCTASAQDSRPAGTGVRACYEITLRPPSERKVDVVADIDGFDPALSELPLKMEEGWAFVRLPEPPLDGPVRASADGRALEIERPEPYRWTLRPAGHTRVQIAYTVPLTHRELPEVRGRHEYEFPFVSDDHGMLATAALLLYSPAYLSFKFRLCQSFICHC